LQTGGGGIVQTLDGGSVFDGSVSPVNLANNGGYGVVVNDNMALTLRGTIGGMNRLWKLVYQASIEKRREG
jgi:hypothetical protein